MLESSACMPYGLERAQVQQRHAALETLPGIQGARAPYRRALPFGHLDLVSNIHRDPQGEPVGQSEQIGVGMPI